MFPFTSDEWNSDKLTKQQGTTKKKEKKKTKKKRLKRWLLWKKIQEKEYQNIFVVIWTARPWPSFENVNIKISKFPYHSH